MTAKEKFKIGDRVHLSEKGREMRAMPLRLGYSVRSGTIVGFGRDPLSVRVQLDGNLSSTKFNIDFLEVENLLSSSWNIGKD